MRPVIAAAIAAAILTSPIAAPPASATGGVAVFTCTLNYEAPGPVRGVCTEAGVVDGTVVVRTVAAVLYFNWAACPLSGGGYGTIGWMDIDMTRVGVVTMVTTTGEINGAGIAEFVPTSIPCGSVWSETAVFTVAGT